VSSAKFELYDRERFKGLDRRISVPNPLRSMDHLW